MKEDQKANVSEAPTLNYRSGVDERADQKRVAEGCLYQMAATLLALGCLVGFFVFAWLAVALLLLTMYPQAQWSAAERLWVGFTCVLTALAAGVCLVAGVRVSPIPWRK